MATKELPKWAETAILAIVIAILVCLAITVMTLMFFAVKAWINP